MRNGKTMSQADTAKRVSPLRLIPALFQSMRPVQWTKNGMVLVPFFFALWDRAQHRPQVLENMGRVIWGVAAFCIVSSAIYVLNDLCDLKQDRLHPEKRLRPIASGRLPVPAAMLWFVILLSAGILMSAKVSTAFLGAVASYAILQLLYSFKLKHLGLLDVFVIAGGFVLRAVAGAYAADVQFSTWLLLCAFLLALFLALCKRRHEKEALGDAGREHRSALSQYDARGLDQYIGISGCATIVCYAIYTQSPETVAKFGTHALGYSVPFVVFGIFRYIDLLYRNRTGGRPEKVLVSDPPLIITLMLYAFSVWIAFYMGIMS